MGTDDIILILVCLVIILVYLFLVVFLFITMILSCRSTHLFFISAYKSIDIEDVDKRVQSIRNEYEVYRKRRFGAGWKDIISLCQELSSKLKSSKEDCFRGWRIPSYYIMYLEEVIEILKEDYNFEDEKINQMINEIETKADKDCAKKVKEYIIRLQAYCQGQLFEKESEKQHYLAKMERKKWFNRLCGIIGIIGSIASIYSLFG